MKKLSLFLSSFLLLSPAVLPAQWDFSEHALPLNEIQSGGPPKDGIPALSELDDLPAVLADYMRSERALFKESED